MSLDEQQERQLLALLGRVANLERATDTPVDTSLYSEKSYVNKLFPIPRMLKVEDLTDDKTLTNSSQALQVFTTDGTVRTINLPSASWTNGWFVIINNNQG